MPAQLPLAFEGMAQDFSRNALPKGKAWNMVDWIPDVLGAPLTERGGWGYAAAALTTVQATASYVTAAFEAPFTGGTQVLMVDDVSPGHLIKLAGGSLSLVGSLSDFASQNPVMHRQTVVIPCDGSNSIALYGGSSLSFPGSSAPFGKYAAVFVDRTVLAGVTSSPQSIYFSAAGDPTSWPTSTLNTSFPIKGLAALPNVLLAFGLNRTARIRGTTPPPGTDMSMDDPIFAYGCIDARSIAVQGSFATFANQQGVFLTDGTATPEDLTRVCGVSTYWKNLLTGYSSTWTVASGWFGSTVIVCVMNGSTLVDTLAFDTVNRYAFRVSNLKATCFAQGGSAGQELYAGSRVSPRLLTLSSMWTPGSSFKADADGTAVTGVYESPFYNLKTPGVQRWRFAYPDYDLRDAASDNPSMTLAFTESPESGASYTTAGTMPKTTKRLMAKLPISARNNGLAFKVTRTNAAAYARLYGLSALVYPIEKQL